MRVLFDQSAPRPLRVHLPKHSIDTAAELGWSQLGNGELLARAEGEAYDFLITADQNMQDQQNLTGRQLAIVVPGSNRWPRVRQRIDAVRAAVEQIQPGELKEVPI